jgi:hypothetical protein
VIASIISVINGAIQIVLGWMAASRDKLLRSLGVMEQKNEDMTNELEDISKAQEARNDIEGELAKNPDSINDDDGFRRD